MSQHDCNEISGFPSGDDLEARFTLFLVGVRRAVASPGAARAASRRLLAELSLVRESHRHTAAPLIFGLFVALQLTALLACIRYFFRSDMGSAPQPPDLWRIVVTCLACNLVLCFGEYFFHRYILHIETVRFLRSLCTSHLTHHKLTFIRFDERSGTVRSAYPITDAEHDDQSTFPPWALVPFFAFFTPFFAPMAFSFPGCRFSSAAMPRLPSPISSTRRFMACTTSRTRRSGSRASSDGCSGAPGRGCTASIRRITRTTSAT